MIIYIVIFRERERERGYIAYTFCTKSITFYL